VKVGLSIERQKHASILGRQAYLGFYVEGGPNVPKMFVMGQSCLLLGKRKQLWAGPLMSYLK
jgi:hypothetical protein